MLSHKSVSDKKWRQYQLLQVPFLCGTSSIFSHTENEKNNFLKKVCTTEDKDCSSNDSETTTKQDNKEKNTSSYIIPTLKPFKSIQPLEIPSFLMKENTFQFPSVSHKSNNKMPSTSLKEMQWKNFKSQPSLMQSKQINCVHKVSGIEEQQLKSDKNTVKASSVSSEFKEKSYQPISKQECIALAERAQVSLTYFRGNSTHTECSQTFAENDFKDKMLENSDGDDDHKSRVPIYISAEKLQNEKHISCTDILKRTGRSRSNETVAVFPIQKSIPVITEALEKNNLNIYYGVYNSNTSICLHEAESKLSATEILDFKRFLTKNITFESNCPHIIVQSFPATKVSFTMLRRKEWFKLKFSLQNMLFGRFRSWIESFCKDMPIYQEDGILRCLHFCEILKEQYDTQELVKSNSSKSHNNNICICLLAIISKHQNMKILKTVFTSFFNSKNTLLPTEGKYMQVEKHPLCGRRPIQINSCVDNSLRQNIEFHKKYEIYPCIISPKLLENTCFELHNECQKTDFSRLLGKEKKSSFLNKETLFCNQKSGLSLGRCVRKHRLLCRGSKGFLSMFSASVSDKQDMKKQLLVAKCLILPEGSSGYSSLEMYYSNIRKIKHLTGATLRFFNYLPASSQMKFEKLNSKCSSQQILLTTIKHEKKPSKMCSSFLHGERLKTFSFILNEKKRHKTTGCRNCIKSTNDVTYTMKECLSSSNYINPDKKEYVKSRDLQINSHNFLSKNSFSIFDTHKKIPLSTDSEDLDQIPLVKQDSSVKEEYSEENTVTTSENVHNLPAKSNGVLILFEQSKTTMEKCHSLLLHNSQTNQTEHCKKMDGYSPHLANEKKCVDYPDTYLNSGNIFPSLLTGFQYIISPLDSSPFVNKDAIISEDGHCRSSLSAEKQKQYEPIHTTLQYPATGSPTLTDTYLQRQAEETVHFSLHRHTQTTNTFSLEPATSKQNFEYVKEEEEISGEQMHVTNESQCEPVMNDLIMSYSEDESKTFIAVEEKLKMHLSIMNNGCLEDVKDEYLPSESKIKYKFELKRKFDLVLEELHMFHEISKGNENNLSSVETNSHNSYCELNSEGIDENVKNASQKKICISFPICDTTEGQNITAINQSSSKEKISSGNEEQKVSNEYCISRQSSEEFLHSSTAEGKHMELLPHMLINKYKILGKSLVFIRVQPLKTCRGPIRIGLSRKARPKQLHPYLK
uniref:RAD51 interacting motif domain-containing protein n=1 Tax=Dromaius novaehollandiae TaxID=8790 RepID=A0A8C4JVY7_DRONO